MEAKLNTVETTAPQSPVVENEEAPPLRHSLGYEYGTFLCGLRYPALENTISTPDALADTHIQCVVCAALWRAMPEGLKLAYTQKWYVDGLLG